MASSINGSKPHLRFLFTAIFEDGTVIEQTQDDVSVIDPVKRSAFFDVCEHEKVSKLNIFLLSSQEGNVYGVDLRSGLFSTNGSEPFSIADQNFITNEPFRLVYFRETRIEKDIIGNELIAEGHYISKFFIGWQTTVNGENIQRTISLEG